ncbi:hypothetical protein J2Z83_000399 [Virgibacillus natechei]|uniref:Uncharacterized protein n=1 Tax=Virgibacillus natechei TaxID=1216297 RepID=A0ABS4IBJ3_9BACI|nr:hypothetical protein [Virgibacillus natechei]MBP1968307.1 hypothetical protein [Virgibacillus natechei]UZD14431.1 hypothetical protein OLD84_08030 [Virgibacillus natechei]
MNKVQVNIQKDLAHGTLLWIYAHNKKVYHSSKRLDNVAFNEHDSNYLGEVKKIFSNKDKQESLLSLLDKVDRIYGICINDQVTTNSGEKEVEVLFFQTWDEVQEYAETYFEKFDQQESKKEQVKQEWLERGRRYLRKG